MKKQLFATLAALWFLSGPCAAFSVPADSVADPVKTKKHDCCEDTTVTDHSSPYHKLVKEGGSKEVGLLTVRHIKDKWYFEVPDSLLGRLILAVTRFTSVPQDFKMLGGEEVNRSCLYFEQYNEKTLFLREYVQSSFAKKDDAIGQSLKQATIDPIVYKFDVIGRNPDTQDQLIEVTRLFLSDNKITSFSNNDRTQLGIGSVQSDRTFVDTVKTYPINVEIQTLRTYSMTDKFFDHRVTARCNIPFYRTAYISNT